MSDDQDIEVESEEATTTTFRQMARASPFFSDSEDEDNFEDFEGFESDEESLWLIRESNSDVAVANEWMDLQNRVFNSSPARSNIDVAATAAAEDALSGVANAMGDALGERHTSTEAVPAPTISTPDIDAHRNKRVKLSNDTSRRSSVLKTFATGCIAGAIGVAGAVAAFVAATPISVQEELGRAILQI